jgi:hypothetical protein
MQRSIIAGIGGVVLNVVSFELRAPAWQLNLVEQLVLETASLDRSAFRRTKGQVGEK